MPLTAVPPHLQINDYKAVGKGTDWDVFGLRYIPQHWMAFGPNATEKIGWITLLPIPCWFQWHEIDLKMFGHTFTFSLPEPIKWTRLVFPIPVPAKWRRFHLLIIGKGITRWEGQNAKSQLFIAPYVEGWHSSFFGRRNNLPATEMNPDHAEHGDPLLLDGLTPRTSLKNYSPGVIQYWSDFSLQLTWPIHFVIRWNWGGRNPSTGKHNKSLQFRIGFRHDALDDYTDGPSASLGSGN